MNVIVQIFRLIYFQSFEVGIANEFFGGNHLKCSLRNDLTLEIDLVDDNTESIQFCEMFKLLNVFSAFQEYFLMLTSEVVVHLLHSGDEVDSRQGQLCEFKVF